ncbi:MAG TPA: glycosyltransferase family 39 protein, partial [Dehalococcoidia bacterium]|nr:glycosyltransferase family 39 protein [Dehalococcoidia bacterium]
GRWPYLVGSLAGALTVGALIGVATKAPLPPPQLLALGAGIAWVLTGSLLEGGPRAELEALRGALQSVSRRDWLVLGGIVLLAAALRFSDLGDLPFGLWYDEAAIGLEGHRILTDSAYRPLYAPSTTSPAAFVYLVAGAEALFGKTVFAVRFVPALMGVLSTLLSYVVGRKLFGPWAGVCAAALFAVARWDINFSRIGMQGATAPFLTLLTCALALAALKSRRMAVYAALGVAIGSLFWFYTSSVFFIAVLLAPLSVLILRERSFLKTHQAGLAVALAGALLAAAPVLLQAWMTPEQLLNRPQQASIFRGKTAAESVEAVRTSLGQHLLMFHIRGDPNGRHNLPGEPMLDWFTGIFMLFGVVAALRQWRDVRSLLLLSWLVIMLLPGVLSLEFEAPQGLRSIGVIPAAVLLATLGLERFTVSFRPLFNRSLSSAFAMAGLALVTALNAGTYFGAQANNFAVWNGFSTAESMVGRRLAEKSSQDQRALVSVFYLGHPAVRFYTDTTPETLNATEQLPLRKDVNTVLFLEPQEEATYHLVRRYYPKADCTERLRRPEEPVVLYTCTVPSDVITASRGLVARYTHLSALGTSGSSEQLLSSTAIPPPISTGREGYLVEVEGGLLAPTFGIYRFALDGPPTARFSLDDKELLVGGTTPVAVQLARGLHKLRLSGPVGGDASDIRLQWQPPGGEWGIVPQDLLFHGSVQPMGLVGSYVPGATAGADVAFRVVDASPAIYF